MLSGITSQMGDCPEPIDDESFVGTPYPVSDAELLDDLDAQLRELLTALCLARKGDRDARAALAVALEGPRYGVSVGGAVHARALRRLAKGEVSNG
jgi:hypothetical protein